MAETNNYKPPPETRPDVVRMSAEALTRKPEYSTSTESSGFKISSTPPETSSWEKAFDISLKDYADNVYFAGDPLRTKGTTENDLKDFVRSVATSEYKLGVEEASDEIAKLMLRIANTPLDQRIYEVQENLYQARLVVEALIGKK